MIDTSEWRIPWVNEVRRRHKSPLISFRAWKMWRDLGGHSDPGIKSIERKIMARRHRANPRCRHWLAEHGREYKKRATPLRRWITHQKCGVHRFWLAAWGVYAQGK